MFDPELKVKWLEALRSDKYEQGRSHLRTADNRFCCLGVLCDVIDPTRWTARRGSSWLYMDREGFVPIDVATKTGMRSSLLGALGDDDTSDTDACQFHLSAMNDNGSSFAEIADWIEKKL